MTLCDQLDIQNKTKSDTAVLYAEALVQHLVAA